MKYAVEIKRLTTEETEEVPNFKAAKCIYIQ